MRQLQWKTWTREESEAAIIADRHLLAFNSTDLEAICDCVDAAVVVYEIGVEEPRIRGREAYCEYYRHLRRLNPRGHAVLEQREVHGRFVTDFQRITLLSDGADRRVKTILEVVGNRIVRVWYTEARI